MILVDTREISSSQVSDFIVKYFNLHTAVTVAAGRGWFVILDWLNFSMSSYTVEYHAY